MVFRVIILSLIVQEDDHEMEVDAATSAIQTPTPTAKHLLPELEIYCYLLVLLFLIDQKKYKEVSSCIAYMFSTMQTGK